MKIRAAAMALIGWQLCAAPDALAIVPCHRYELSWHSRKQMVAAIRGLTAQPLDFRTLYPCHWGRGPKDPGNVWIETQHTDEADGSQRWRTAHCSGGRKWECTLSNDHRSIEVSIPGYPRRIVEIPLDMPVAEARASVMQAYSLLPMLNAEHFSPGTAPDQVGREIFEIRQLAGQEGFNLRLSKAIRKDGIDRYDFVIGQYTLALERVAADDPLRISAVTEEELVE